MQILDPLTLPLNQSVLIEASAGTGKTYTMANLYLRLILGVGCEPLSAEQILVVTFTKAATQELRDRIRAKLGSVAGCFADPESDEAKQAFQDPFLHGLFQAVRGDLPKARLRLKIAEREMDLAAIFTIDSFCQKMLFQYAFDSGVRFDIDLQTDESPLLKRLSEETWRELFYPADFAETALVAQILRTPEQALSLVKPYLSGMLPPFNRDQSALLECDHCQTTADFLAFITQVKQYWRTYGQEMVSLIRDNLNQAKTLNGSSYKESYLENWQSQLDEWANGETLTFPYNAKSEKQDKYYLNRFSQSFIVSKTNKGKTPLAHPHFEQVEQFICGYTEKFGTLYEDIRIRMTVKFFHTLRQKLTDYKQSHIEKNFTDMLTYFHQALHSAKRETLADKIRHQFKFAMIDESQDTNQVQYEIFRTLFMAKPSAGGFILIGDPKQSIYKFRGADIFSYLTAAKEVDARFTLAKNWRSLPEVVEGVNRLFHFPETAETAPFLYQDICFTPVAYKTSSEQLCTPKQAWNIYLQPNAYHQGHLKSDLLANQCADQIQKQLHQALNGEQFICDEQGTSRPLQPQDIAILVRSHKDAARIKAALAQRQIQSVYLSEDNSVYATQEAKDLALILTACLNPYHQTALLNALATSLWGLDAQSLYQLKNSENVWESYVEAFIGYRQIWQTQGVLPMLNKLMMQQGIIRRLKQGENADRRLTNLLHLSELLQADAEQTENETALLYRFEKLIAKPKTEGNDAHILRLESEEKLIKIITIHKSKGLEYPVVWLPFIAKKSQGAEAAPLSLYRDENRQLCWDLNSNTPEIDRLKNEEAYAEDLRLLYVALTRAKYQLHLILPQTFSAAWNPMQYLLANGEIPKQGIETETALTEKQIATALFRLDDNPPETAAYLPLPTQQEAPQARLFQGEIRRRGEITSFTALHAQHERLQNRLQHLPLAHRDEARDYDQTADVQLPPEEQQQAYSPYTFPHSMQVGNRLHQCIEQWDFQHPLSQTAAGQLCTSLQLDSLWVEPVIQWFDQIKTTRFSPQAFSLEEVVPHKRLNEWSFYLRLRHEKALPQLNQLLKNESRLAAALPDLQLKQLEGFVRGFIDLIVEVGGKFYVIDYKSNFLGYLPTDYTAEKLAKTMGQYRYDLQYLLYTLAVHRYLAGRLGEKYDYERDFGGVAYLFLRGMNGEQDSGVYFDKPSRTLIEEMDKLFG